MTSGSDTNQCPRKVAHVKLPFRTAFNYAPCEDFELSHTCCRCTPSALFEFVCWRQESMMFACVARFAWLPFNKGNIGKSSVHATARLLQQINIAMDRGRCCAFWGTIFHMSPDGMKINVFEFACRIVLMKSVCATKRRRCFQALTELANLLSTGRLRMRSTPDCRIVKYAICLRPSSEATFEARGPLYGIVGI